MKVLVVDYGMGNLNSVRRSLETCGASVEVSDNPAQLATASAIVLPGVGAFSDGMASLREKGWEAPLAKAVLVDRIPLLGICLGMQLLADSGTEGGMSKGLGFVAGEVTRLQTVSGERIPHMGWNEVSFSRKSCFFDGIQDSSDFYFVHSFHFKPKKIEHVAAMTPYCGGFVSAVEAGTIFGTQFHPEKSSKAGLRLLKNFLAQARVIASSC